MDTEGLLAEPLDSHLLRLSGDGDEMESSAVSFEPFPSLSGELEMEPRAEDEDMAMDEDKAPVESEEEGDDMSQDGGASDASSRLYCFCRQPDDGTFMISCDKCQEW
jgi:hypothetical protein